MEIDGHPVSFARARRVAGYNWPLYMAATFVFVLGGLTAYCPGLPMGIRWVAGLGAGVALWFACASFWAFHMMFDRSELLGGMWLQEELGQIPERWVQINAGLEETTLPLEQVFPEAEGMLLDLYDPSVMTEPAIARAHGPVVERTRVAVRPDAIPAADASADLVVVVLAAHEIRDKALREQFFLELRRIVANDGLVVIVEHLRDVSAALAFGPGMFHFYPRREWLRLAELAGLELIGERPITRFVRVFKFR